MSAIEFALMLDSIAKMVKDPVVRSAVIAQRDACAKDIPAELEHNARIGEWLQSALLERVDAAMPIEIPLSYGPNSASRTDA